MSPHDVYAPPAASVNGATPAEIAAKANGEVILAGIGARIGASLIDTLVFMPLLAADAYIGAMGRGADIAMFFVSQIAALGMYVVTVRRYGGTPGKLLLGLRVAMADGSPVTWKAAILRYSVYWLTAAALGVGEIIAALDMPDDAYLAGGYFARADALSAHSPAWVWPLNLLIAAWVIACFISLLATKRRRTLYDFQAGTIVVRPF